LAADRKPFLVRLDPALLRALQRWAGDDLRSLNAQIEFLLRDALVNAGRMKPPAPPSAASGGAAASGTGSGGSPGG
jgi:hypothetical protein